MVSKLRIKIKSDVLVFLAIYIVGLWEALSFMVIRSDRLLEYSQYLAILDSGGAMLWNGANEKALVSSSLFATWLPAKIQLLTGVDPELLFKIFPCIFLALMPAFVYLISRKYFNKIDSLYPSALILGSFYFAYYPSFGRTSIGWGILAGLVWAIIQKRYVFATFFAIVLALSYYGASYYMLFVLGFTLISLLVLKIYNRYRQRITIEINGLKIVSITFAVLLVAVGYWYMIVNSLTATIAGNVVEKSLEVDIIPSPDEAVETTKSTDVNRNNVWNVKSRDGVTQSLLGMTFLSMSIPQRIEFIFSWLIIIIISLGLAKAFKRQQLSLTHRVLALAMYGAVVATIALPVLGATYGVSKSGFSGFVGYAPCYVIGCNLISSKMRINKHIIASTILIVYSLCVFGVMHSFFGIAK